MNERKQIGPGVWEENNELHVSISEVLKEFGIANTPENVEKLSIVITEVANQHYPGMEIKHVTD